MLTFIVFFLVCIIAVEAAVELLVKSVIFDGFSTWFASLGTFAKELISCGYCTSVWVAVLPALFLAYFQDWASGLIVFPLFLLALHRSANYLHNINDKHFDKDYDKRYTDSSGVE